MSHGLAMDMEDSSPDKVTRPKQRFKRIPVRLYPLFSPVLAIQNAHDFCNRATKLLNSSYS